MFRNRCPVTPSWNLFVFASMPHMNRSLQRLKGQQFSRSFYRPSRIAEPPGMCGTLCQEAVGMSDYLGVLCCEPAWETAIGVFVLTQSLMFIRQTAMGVDEQHGE